MKLQTPVTGTVINVADEQAGFYISRGFIPIAEPEKKTTRKRTTKKGQ